MIADDEWIYYDFEQDIYSQDQERIYILHVLKLLEVNHSGANTNFQSTS